MTAWILTKGVYDRSVSVAREIDITWSDGWKSLLDKCKKGNDPKQKKLGWSCLFAKIVDGATKLDALAVTHATAIVLDLDTVGRQWDDPDAPSRTTEQVVEIAKGALAPHGFAWWETWQSRPTEVRMRLVVPCAAPLDQPTAAKVWAVLARKLTDAGIPSPDKTSKEATRLNLLPTVHSKVGVVDGTIIPGRSDAVQLHVELSGHVPEAAKPEETIVVIDLDMSAGPVVGVKASPPLGNTPPKDGIGSDVVLEWEAGGFSSVSEITPDIVTAKSRPNEKRARCRCPHATDTTSFSAFARFCRGLLYVTCSSTSHGHPAGMTWSYAPTDRSATGVLDLNAPIIPYPYRMGPTGALLKEDGEDESGSPVYKTIAYTTPRVSTIYQDEESGEEWWKIEWFRFNGPPVEVVLRRDECGSASKLIDKAGRVGLDIHECNKRELTRYLSDYVSANFAKIRLQSVASRSGWFGNGFLWGQHWISDVNGDEPPRELVVPSGDGRSQLAYGMRPAGTLAGWVDAVRLVLPYPLALAGIYAALASVIVERIACQACVLEWASSTGTGKTTCLRMAASVWGSPDDLITGWDGTRAGLERRASFLHNMPMFKDDTKTSDQAKNSVEPEWAIYRVVSGEGRERATPGGGMQTTAKWALNLLMTGEEPVYGNGQSGGARARLLSIQDPPFGLSTKDQVSRLVAPMSDGTTSNAGTAGPAFAAFVSQIPSAKLRATWDKRRQHYITLLDGKHSAADRISSHIALLETAGILLEAALVSHGCPLGGKPREIMESVAERMCEVDVSSGEVDPFDRSVMDFYAWCVAHRSGFWSGTGDDGKGPVSGWLGRWDGGDSWTSFYYTPAAVDRFLRESRYPGSATHYASQWIKRGHSVPGTSRPTWKIRVAGAAMWAYRIDREAKFLKTANEANDEAPSFMESFAPFEDVTL